MAVLFIQLLWPLLAAEIGPRLRIAQGLFVVAGLAVAVTPGLKLNARVHPFWMLGGVCGVAAGLREVVRGDLARIRGPGRGSTFFFVLLLARNEALALRG